MTSEQRMAVLKKIASGNADDIVWQQLPSYRMSGGKVVPGLENRRNDAVHQFKPEISPSTAPRTADEIYKSINEALGMAAPFVRRHEGFKSNAYWDDIGKKWTIGHGFTQIKDPKTGIMRAVRKGDVIDEATSSALVDKRLRDIAIRLHKSLPWTHGLNSGARAALYDVAFNAGAGILSPARSPNLNRLMANVQTPEI